MSIYDLLTALAVIALTVGIVPFRTIPPHKRLWIGLALLAGAYCSASVGLTLIRTGFDSQLLRYVWAGSFGTLAILSVILLVPLFQDWLGARLQRGQWQGSSAR
jgi:hypothetical protein